MADIKNLAPISEWITYELDTELLNPPVLKLRLRPMTGWDAINIDAGQRSVSSTMAEMIIGAIVDWDLSEKGEPIPCNEDAKARHSVFLRCLLGQKLKDARLLLGLEIALFAGNAENFLKN
ncbi:MAG TPA: hypothetical protein VMY39_05410 [Planctomycetota bacterium]|nr:hypothetical protein [Planctomycetota bacterium]